MKYSIVIPTYNHFADLLRPCLDSIYAYTDLSDVEIIVVANGCKDETRNQLLNSPVKLIWVDEAIGYTKATNLGIKQAIGDFVILMNNDVVLLPQTKNSWLDMLHAPFISKKVGITGPVKFDWACGGQTYEAMAFWLVMISREVINQIGILDEIYSPGMGEDGDYCIRASRAGYGLVSVPSDVKGHFDVGIKNLSFPIYHVGNGTFADDTTLKNEIIDRNNKILADKYGKSNLGKWHWYQDEQNKVPYGDTLTYTLGAGFLRDCVTVEDWGCGTCFMSTILDPNIIYTGIDGSYSKYAGKIVDLVTYKSPVQPDGIYLRHVLEHNYSWKAIIENAVASFSKKMVLVLFTPITKTTTVLKVNTDIDVPDISFSLNDILPYFDGLKYSVEEHHTNTDYGVEYIFYIERQRTIDVSIVVPTYNHLDDALRPCLENILKYSDLSNKEVIVVANGCTDGTLEYLRSKDIRYIYLMSPAGYIGAVNWGISVAHGTKVVLIDNDSILMPQPVDNWINTLAAPFIDGQVGATSPFANEYEDMGLVVHSGCTMYDKQLLVQVGMFDEIYNPGYFSDSDVAMKIWKAGYKCVEVPEYAPNKKYENGVFVVHFPVVHTGEVQTMNKQADIEIVKRNREILYSRYGRKMKYSIVIPTYNHCDDLLRPCIESIYKYTDMSDVEIIVSANGCTDNTRAYCESIGVKLIWSDEAVGYTKATNLGIQAATGDYVVLLNNDTELLVQPKNHWLEWLESVFVDPKVGIVGPLEMFDTYSNHKVLIFFCVMIPRHIFAEVGLLDEIYSPGGGEDIDFTIRVKAAGYKSVEITPQVYTPEKSTNVGSFPIWHKDNQTFKSIPEYTKVIMKRNGFLNCKRYNNDIRLNLGAGGIEYPGFLSVDLYDARANIPMNIEKLDFDNNSVSEIMASHVFEHLNPYHSVDILAEWLRVLKPGGKLSMEMPDIEKLCRSFLETNDYYKRLGTINVIYGSVNTTTVGGPDNITSPHLFGWWPESLFYHLQQAGYVDISFPPEQWPHPGDNLRVEAYKPALTIDRARLEHEDINTYYEVIGYNTYKVETNEVRGKTVIDVGANLGFFSLLCIEKGAGRVIAVEAQPIIYNIGLLNFVKGYTDIIPVNYAMLDVDGSTVHIPNHHVGSRVGGTEGETVSTITLKTLLDQHNVIGNDLVLKLDCEGSEFDILMNIDIGVIRRFALIYIELHGNTNANPAYADTNLLEDKLVSLGFEKHHQWEMMEDDGTGKENWKHLLVFVEKWVRK